MWVAIHKCMEATLGISLQQNWRRGQNRFCVEVGTGQVGEVAQTMFIYVK
jgi:hypothetical protein